MFRTFASGMSPDSHITLRGGKPLLSGRSETLHPSDNSSMAKLELLTGSCGNGSALTTNSHMEVWASGIPTLERRCSDPKAIYNSRMVSSVLDRVRRAFARGVVPYVAIGVAVLVSLVVCWFAYEKILPRTFVSASRVQAEIARELPRGSSQAQIIDFLNKKNWSPHGPAKVTAPIMAGVPDGTLWITGLIPHVERTWWGDHDLGLYFILDTNGRFDRVIVRGANYNGP